MELFKLFGTILVDNDKANASIRKTDDLANQSSNSMTTAFKKVGGALVAAFSVKEIIDFGKQCVETAAQVKASNSQFEQSFTVGGENLLNEAKGVLDGVAEYSGVLSTRLQDSGTKIYSFAKSSGASSAEAMKLMEDALKAAADGAAYYDKSLEDTSETLMSFMKGNFANDAALGVSCTETTRNAKAMELFGQKYNDLSEVQKQQTLLRMVTDAQAVSGAMGQASREADGWENVMGNLKESWKQFQAVLGAPILEMVIPIVKTITQGIQGVSDKVKYFIDNWDVTMASLKPLWDEYGQPVFDAFENIIQLLYEQWQLIFPSIQTLWDNLLSSISFIWENIGKPVFEFVQQKAKDIYDMFMQYFPQVAQIVKDVFDLINKFWVEVLQPVFVHISHYVQEILVPFWEAKWAVIKEAVNLAFSGIMWAWENVLKPLLNGIIDFLSLVFSGEWQLAWESIQTTVSTIWGNIKAKVEEIVQAIRDKIEEKITEAKDKVSEIFGKIYDKIVEKLNAAKTFVSGVIDEIKGFFDFEWSLPNIELPSISGLASSIGNKIGSVLGFEGYASGGIMEKPTAFGFNPYTNNVMVGGESGKEAIAPIDELMGYVRAAVDESKGRTDELLNGILGLLSDMLPQMNQTQLVLDTGALVGELTPSIDAQLGNIQRRKER